MIGRRWNVNIEIKAALLSGLVFPGLGQIYLKQYLRGLVMMVLVLSGVVVIVAIATAAALESLNAIRIQGETIDMNTISNLAAAHSAQNSIYYKVILLLIACCWIFSIIDAYRTGKKKEMGNLAP